MYIKDYVEDFPVLKLALFSESKDKEKVRYTTCDAIISPCFDITFIPRRCIEKLNIKRQFIDRRYVLYSRFAQELDIYKVNIIICIKDMHKVLQSHYVVSYPSITIYKFLNYNFPLKLSLLYDIAEESYQKRASYILNILREKDPYLAFLNIQKKYPLFWGRLKKKDRDLYEEIERFASSFKYGYIGKDILNNLTIVLSGNHKKLIVDNDELGIRHEAGGEWETEERKPQTLTILAKIRHYQGNLQEAEKIYSKSAQMDKTPVGKCKVLRQKGLLYYDSGDYVSAEHFLKESLKIAENIGDKWGQGLSCAHLGRIFQLRARFSEAKEYFEKASMYLPKNSPYQRIIKEYLSNLSWAMRLQ